MRCCDIPIGKMRRLISIERASEIPDGAGGFETTWSEIGTAWAWFKTMSGNERLYGMQLENPVTHKIYIRYRTDIDERDRIVYQGRYFNIRALLDLEELRRYIEITAEEGVAVES